MECHVTENMILETLLSFDGELRQAYNAKEEYLIFDQVSKIILIKRKELNAVIKKIQTYTCGRKYKCCGDAWTLERRNTPTLLHG